MVEKIKENEDLFRKYLEYFLERFVYASIEIEGFTNEEARKMDLKNLEEAFLELYTLEEDLNHFNIEHLGNRVNKYKHLTGYRKIEVSSGSDFEPAPPGTIRPKIFSLIDNYYNIWDALPDVFEREAKFCISLMRIHPFEDGNKRVAKLILNNNLLKNNKAPVILTKEDNDMFYDYINNQNEKGLAELLKQRSALERNTMVGFIKTLDFEQEHVQAPER
jgi:prophage maintenance system killer protein